jgi:opacity protein-like surface antigen
MDGGFMSRTRTISLLAALAAAVLIAAPTALARAGGGSGGMALNAGHTDGDSDNDKDKDNDKHLRAQPWVFVGSADQCAPAPAGSRIVTSAWLGGMGLPDKGGDTALNGVPATRNDPHLGLLLNKNGPTPDCSSAGATINGVKGMTIADATTFIVGYDYRQGGHCGAGAPRFNLVVRTPSGDKFTYFIGCAASVQTPAPQDPAQWTRSRSALIAPFTVPAGPAPQPAVIPAGSRIQSLDIVFDEGTDTPGLSDPAGVGLAVLDNIFVNGQYIRSGSGIRPGGDGHADEDHG